MKTSDSKGQHKLKMIKSLNLFISQSIYPNFVDLNLILVKEWRTGFAKYKIAEH